MTAPKRPRRRLLFRLAVVLGVALVVAGAIVGYLGYEKSSGPDGAVRGYFTAIAPADAPRALAWGTVPRGSHQLLTSEVLQVQQRIAPLENLRIGRIDRNGSNAVVHVTYTLGFTGAPVRQSVAVRVGEHDGDWRLDASAIPTQLLLNAAADRALILGAKVPGGETLVFPGAVPVTFDTPYLALDPSEDVLAFGAGPVADVAVRLSTAGLDATRAAMLRRLTACYSGRGDAACPLPDDRYVPGSLRGRIDPAAVARLTITLDDSSAAGVIDIGGRVPLMGTYQRLTFANRPTSGKGTVSLGIDAQAYVAAPLTITWTIT